MKAQNIRKCDQNGRVQLRKSLMEVCNLKNMSKVAICSFSENQIMIRNLDDVKDCKVIEFTRIDEKGRIIIPYTIRDTTTEVEVYVKNGNLILEEAH